MVFSTPPRTATTKHMAIPEQHVHTSSTTRPQRHDLQRRKYQGSKQQNTTQDDQAGQAHQSVARADSTTTVSRTDDPHRRFPGSSG
eukprot:309408-Pyramimonas_sp.AAC.1